MGGRAETGPTPIDESIQPLVGRRQSGEQGLEPLLELGRVRRLERHRHRLFLKQSRRGLAAGDRIQQRLGTFAALASPPAIAAWSSPGASGSISTSTRTADPRPLAASKPAAALRSSIGQPESEHSTGKRFIRGRIDRHQRGERGGSLGDRGGCPLGDLPQRPLGFLELESAGQLDPQVDLAGIPRTQQRPCMADGELLQGPTRSRPAFLESLEHRLEQVGLHSRTMSLGLRDEVGQGPDPVEGPVPRDVVDEANHV